MSGTNSGINLSNLVGEKEMLIDIDLVNSQLSTINESLSNLVFESVAFGTEDKVCGTTCMSKVANSWASSKGLAANYSAPITILELFRWGYIGMMKLDWFKTGKYRCMYDIPFDLANACFDSISKESNVDVQLYTAMDVYFDDKQN